MSRILLAIYLVIGLCCGAPADQPAPSTSRRSAASALSNQGGTPVTSFAGVIDPTNTSFGPGGLQACTGSCSTGLTETNRLALQAAFDVAAAQNKMIFLPAGTYPISRKAASSCGVDTTGDNNVVVEGYGAILRQTGDATSSAFSMLCIKSNNIALRGLAYSQRDVTNSTVDTVAVLIGDGGTTSVDGVLFEDSAWTEGVGGDYLRLDGGGSASTVNRITVTRQSRFEGAAKNAIDVRPGVQNLVVSYSFFKGNNQRDLLCEAATDNVLGRIQFVGNYIDRTGSTSAATITVSGNGGSNSNDQTIVSDNRITDGVIEGVNLSRASIDTNAVQYTVARGSTANIDLSGKISDVVIADNFLERDVNASSGTVLHVGNTSGSAAQSAIINGNRIYQYTGTSPGIDVSGTQRAEVVDNDITYHASTGDSGATGFAGVYCAGNATNTCSGLYARNRVSRQDQVIKASLDLHTVTTNDNTVVQAKFPGRDGNGITIAFVGDAVASAGTKAESGQAVTIHYKPAATTVAQVETLIATSVQIEVKTAGTAGTVLQVGDAFSATHFTGGVQAGRPLAAIEVLVGGGTTVNRLTLRDNVADGTKDILYADADGSAAWPDGFPVIAGNWSVNGVVNEIEGGLTTTRRESTSTTETVSTGALAPAKSMSFITTAGVKSYTLADGVVDGAAHCIKITAGTSSPAGTLTPAHFADGTTHTLTWTTAGYACLVWDATAVTYRLRDFDSTNITLH